MADLSDGRFVEERRYEIKHLWNLHHDILRQSALGRKNVDIAETLNITPATVSYTRNSILGKEKLEGLQEQADAETVNVVRRIKMLAPKALDVLNDILDDKVVDIRIQKDVAFGVLDRAGYGPIRKTINADVPITPDFIDSLKRRAKESGMEIANNNDEIEEAASVDVS